MTDNPKSKIYTKTGDSGTSSLYDGTRQSKTSEYFICLGDIDELNSNLGLLKGFWKTEFDKCEIKFYNSPGAGAMFYKTEKCINSGKYFEWFGMNDILTNIQCTLMDISTLIATPPTLNPCDDVGIFKWLTKVKLSDDIVPNIENLIDRMDSILPPITNFVVPSGDLLVSQTHVCRSVSRRAERSMLNLLDSTKVDLYYHETHDQYDIVKKYMNRLSDFLFILSRFFAMTLNVQEDLYSKSKNLFTKKQTT
jgi:cob(I)alamin adenosyltransferase